MNTAAKLVRRGSQYFGNKDSNDEEGQGDLVSPEEAALREQVHTPQPPDPGAAAMTPEESLRSYELFEALRNFEPGSSDVETLSKAIERAPRDKRTSYTSSSTLCTVPTPLHTAVRCAKPGTVEIVLRHSPHDLNARDPEGQTPLHIACALGRAEIVRLLLSQPNIDDTLKDINRRTALEVSKGFEVAKYIQVSRAQFNESYIALLQAYVNTGPTSGSTTPRTGHHHLHLHPDPARSSQSIDGGLQTLSQDHAATSAGAGSSVSTTTEAARDSLVNFLKKDRSKCLDFTSLTPGHRGTTIIHEAARRRDVEILKLCAARGASMVVRDRKGKMPMDVAKDEQIRQLLRQGATSEGRALKTSAASGMSGRSAPSPQMANLSLTSSNLSTNSIIGAPNVAQPVMKGYLSKWTNMARGYRTRYFVLHHGHISYYRDAEEEGQTSRGTIGMSIAQVDFSSSSYTGSTTSSSSEKATFVITTKLGKSPRWFLKANHPVEAMQWVSALRQSIEIAKQQEQANNSPGASGSIGLGLQARVPSAQSTSSNTSVTPAAQGATRSSGSSGNGGGKRSSLPSSSASSARSAIPQTQVIAATPSSEAPPVMPPLKRKSTTGTMGTEGSMYGDPFTRSPSPVLTEGSFYGDDSDSHQKHKPPHNDNFELLNNSAKTQVVLTEQLVESLGRADPNNGTQRQDLVDAAKRSLKMLEALIEQHLQQVDDREKWFVRRYEREMEAKRMWEESMRSVVSSQAELEQQLVETQRQSSRRKRALKDLKTSVMAEMASPVAASIPGAPKTPTDPPSETTAGTVETSRPGLRSPQGSAFVSTQMTAQLNEIDGMVSESSDDEDDFYDAVEAGQVPLRIETPLQSPDHQEMPKDFKLSPDFEQELQTFEGYRNLRDRLPITSDDRPPVSLWAILKGSIGKDLTKISFPVYFNEPTSMLQRMAEDMEYSECLDAAAAEEDSLKRLAFVAGFAMSNYASTIGRIAKPFNPMLSETFELANLDRKYRYISEQVSHHPPMSACIAESPRWLYYGEVDAKSKFLGKSFEIRPTGIAHADLILPQDWCPGYDRPARRAGYVREHYSWKKVTTSVSNFIMGNPQIDHYGDMEITNHRTGEKCILTFKPRGWKASNACEIKGSVFDAQDNAVWELAGRWNKQLVARRAGASRDALNPDEQVPTVGGASSPKVHPEYLLIWKINKQPPNMPFNLTRFALTLNDANEGIKKYLPPTDCRLRPDQHAFEDGQFEKANELKGALETFQRATRSKRERGELPPHKPRWFERKEDPDTQAGFWEPRREADGTLEYWKERYSNYNRIEAGEQPQWKDVEEIFGVRL